MTNVLRAWALIKNSPEPMSLPEACDEVDRRAANEAPVDDELARIRETLTQTWPRCGGHTPSAAEDWAGMFTADRVEEWLEAGVPFVLAAEDLEIVGIDPRDVRREVEDGITLGLAFALGELSLAEVQRIVLGGEVEG